MLVKAGVLDAASVALHERERAQRTPEITKLCAIDGKVTMELRRFQSEMGRISKAIRNPHSVGARASRRPPRRRRACGSRAGIEARDDD